MSLPSCSLELLHRRAALLKKTRDFFDQRRFTEVSTPVLSPEIIVDQHIDPYETTMYADPTRPSRGSTWYLRTSPEAHMKRLMAAGATAIYQLGPVFRAGEYGPLHNPEFTMLEWYQVADDLTAAMELTTQLWSEVAEPSSPQCQMLSYREAFELHLKFDPLDCSELTIKQRSRQLGGPSSDSVDDHLNYLLSEHVVPSLPRGTGTLIHGFPASQAALARLDPADPATALRFEFYFDGIELANGYDELQCGEELAARFEAENAKRQVQQKRLLRGDNKLAEAMKLSFPPCSGVALGFDRLLLLVTNRKTLDSVIAFDLLRA